MTPGRRFQTDGPRGPSPPPFCTHTLSRIFVTAFLAQVVANADLRHVMSSKTKNSSRDRHPAFRRISGGDGASSGDGARPSNWQRHGTALPSWTDLEPKRNRRSKTEREPDSFLQSVSTVRFAAIILGLAVLFTLYVGHVHATQQLLADVQKARSQNHKLHLKHNRLKGEFDQATGPSVIYDRARDLGLQESVTYGPVITVE